MTPRPVPVAVLTHPDTPATGCPSLLRSFREFARNIGSPVSIGPIITDRSIPKGRVYFASPSEPWVKKARKPGLTRGRGRGRIEP